MGEYFVYVTKGNKDNNFLTRYLGKILGKNFLPTVNRRIQFRSSTMLRATDNATNL